MENPPPSLLTPKALEPPPALIAPPAPLQEGAAADFSRQISVPNFRQSPPPIKQKAPRTRDDSMVRLGAKERLAGSVPKKSSSAIWTRQTQKRSGPRTSMLGRGRPMKSASLAADGDANSSSSSSTTTTTTASSSSPSSASSSASSSSSSSSCTEANEEEDPEAAAKRARQRKQVLHEIIQTEQDYCRDLDVLTEVFMLPLSFRMKDVGCTKADVDVLFSNLEVLINLNKKVLEDFEEQQQKAQETGGDVIQGVGEVLLRMSPYLKMYTQYSANQPNALRRLEYLLKNNAAFKKHVDISTADPRCRGLQFGGYLIKPVQRICKYPLLLRELLKVLPPSHPDYATIEEAKNQIDKTVDAINEGKRTVETQARVVTIANCFENLPFELVTPTRKFVRESAVQLRHSIKSSGQDRVLFLFNDLIIVARETSKRPSYKMQVCVGFSEARFIVLSEQEKVSNAFELFFQKKRWIFCLPSQEAKTEWVADFKALTREMKLAQIRAAKEAQAKRDLQNK